MNLPKTQKAVQLIGINELRLNENKDVFIPNDYQILAKVEAVGLCFSDLKLLKQFTGHVRKGDIVSGADKSVLAEIPSYVPNEKPTVPGHEVCCVIVAVGEKVRQHYVGQRVLVQADWRHLKTANSNAAFGYNFEGALQQYVLIDERVVIEPQSGASFLIPVDVGISASAAALVEPWACVESSYVSKERKSIFAGGKMIVAADSGRKIKGLEKIFASGKPEKMVFFGADVKTFEADISIERVSSIGAIQNEFADDVIYFGSDKNIIEALNDKLAKGGIFNIVLGGKLIGAKVSIDVGKVHYGLTRWIGTDSDDASVSYENIPETGEVKNGDRIIVVGAAGPMGQMHVIRLACSGAEDISITATDFDDKRLRSLNKKASAIAAENSIELKIVNPQKTPMNEKFSYFVIMAPVGAILAEAIKNSMCRTTINIFAGIPAGTKQPIDLDTYIKNKCFMFGTSGSTLENMKIVLRKLTNGRLDTNLSVDAVSGMAGAIDGIKAIGNRTVSGKIIVYPMLEKMGLISLCDLNKAYPAVAKKLMNGSWTQEAEKELLKVAE